jgi:hypothetical protein
LKRLRGTPLARKSQPGLASEHDMVYSPEPPYTVLHTDAVSAREVQAFTRLARYWDLVANSGRFARTLPLLLSASSAFGAFADFSEWLWEQTAKTSGLTPEQLVDSLWEYLTCPRAFPPDVVRTALLADYEASGARSNPTALQGWLSHGKTHPTLAGSLQQRQQLHRASAIAVE